MLLILCFTVLQYLVNVTNSNNLAVQYTEPWKWHGQIEDIPIIHVNELCVRELKPLLYEPDDFGRHRFVNIYIKLLKLRPRDVCYNFRVLEGLLLD